MTILLSALAVAFAAFCVWLTVRIVNRRERWAKWTLALGLAVVLGYPLSIGPACWISSRMNFASSFVSVVYRPIIQNTGDRTVIARLVHWYVYVGSAPGWVWGAGSHSDDFEWADVGV